ncbi:hypothetical protein XA68_15528 [Ophiocordyceps unilateralis]|uniref:Uncharacterized protein n=1 Tax=Ophiocordyceps unilateralis TaxID=268505 RepID=A0A2A9PME1_OPHUN|nr:hypothetical protein XA68_15528 [Ophiocordyceps unilateralis]
MSHSFYTYACTTYELSSSSSASLLSSKLLSIPPRPPSKKKRPLSVSSPSPFTTLRLPGMRLVFPGPGSFSTLICYT